MTPITTTKAKLIFAEQSEDGGFNIPIIPGYNVYVILFETKQATEEDWKGVVDEVNKGQYVVYDNLIDLDYFTSALNSGLSFQKANGMDVNRNYAVIKID